MPALLLAVLALLLLAAPARAAAPTTGFESRNGASFTTHEEELAFISAVAQGSPRVRVTEAGRTKQGRPLQLVEIVAPGPVGVEAARRRPTAMMVCSQHGNEPAGRQACLKLLRDLAFTEEPALVSLMQKTTFLFVPSANPTAGRRTGARTPIRWTSTATTSRSTRRRPGPCPRSCATGNPTSSSTPRVRPLAARDLRRRGAVALATQPQR